MQPKMVVLEISSAEVGASAAHVELYAEVGIVDGVAVVVNACTGMDLNASGACKISTGIGFEVAIHEVAREGVVGAVPKPKSCIVGSTERTSGIYMVFCQIVSVAAVQGNARACVGKVYSVVGSDVRIGLGRSVFPYKDGRRLDICWSGIHVNVIVVHVYLVGGVVEPECNTRMLSGDVVAANINVPVSAFTNFHPRIDRCHRVVAYIGIHAPQGNAHVAMVKANVVGTTTSPILVEGLACSDSPNTIASNQIILQSDIAELGISERQVAIIRQYPVPEPGKGIGWVRLQFDVDLC